MSSLTPTDSSFESFDLFTRRHQPRLEWVHLQVEDSGFRRLLLVGFKLGKAGSEGITDEEFHGKHFTLKVAPP